jgi:ribosomal protein L20
MRFVANLRSRGLGYAEFREGLERAEIELDNESAYGLLLTDPATFTEFVNIARECLDD